MKAKKQEKKKSRKAQIWVETMIYSLIALAIIGAVLAFVRPKIQETQDKAVIEQSIEIMQYIDSKISEAVRGGSGNTRITDIGIKKGSLTFYPSSDEINFTIKDSKYTYSEPGKIIPIGNVMVLTTQVGRENIVTLSLNYDEKYNLKYSENEEDKTLTSSPTPYKIFFGNDGKWEKIGSGKVHSNQPNSITTTAGSETWTGTEIPTGSPFISPYPYSLIANGGDITGKRFEITSKSDALNSEEESTYGISPGINTDEDVPAETPVDFFGTSNTQPVLNINLIS